MLLLSFILQCAGFFALAMAMDRHHRDLLGTAPSEQKKRWLRIGGGTVLLISLIFACSPPNGALGTVWWFGLASVAAVLVLAVCAAPSRNRRAPRKGRGAPRPQ